MFGRISQFDRLLDKATSHLLLEPDWPSIMQICDLIRQNDVQPKYTLAAVKKKLFHQNPHCSLYALQVLESVVKNCGAGIHEELTTRSNCEMLRDLAKTTTHEDVRNKVLELIQAWTFAFRKSAKYRAMKDTMNIMKTEGFKFPTMKETDAMFSADNAPEWTDGDVCHRCRVAFGFVQRKHHCRACGQVFCGQCSQRTTTLPKFGIEKEVRVCDACYDLATKPNAGPSAKEDTKSVDYDLPTEYLGSSLAQQNQGPPRKTEEELREEEEFQLALALSKSEAEEKEKEKLRKTNAVLSNTVVERSPINNSNTPRSMSPLQDDQSMDPELARYLNRPYWDARQKDEPERPASPSAPSPMSNASSTVKQQVNGITDPEMDEFVQTLKSQVEIFVNRMKSNSSRGRSIANDSSVQTLFMNITAMHSRLLRYIQQQDDTRLYYEGLQDKLVQIKDARAALDALREEHCEKLRRQAEEAERIRQLQMAQKLDIMRKKKQEYLQYQRQLALQRIQEQEREMQMRQEQQKQQYLIGSQIGYMGSPVHSSNGQFGQMPGMNPMYYQYNSGPMGVPMGGPPGSNITMSLPIMHQNQGNPPQMMPPMGIPSTQAPPSQMQPMHQMAPNALPHQNSLPMQNPPGLSHNPNMPMPGGIPPTMNQNAPMVTTLPQQLPQNQPMTSIPPINQPMTSIPPINQPIGTGALPAHVLSAPNLTMQTQPNQIMQTPSHPNVLPSHQMGQFPGGPPPENYGTAMNMQQPPQQQNNENNVAELISFD